MTTTADWIIDTREHLEPGRLGERDRLADPYTAGSGSMSFTFMPAGIAHGTILSVGLNTLYVWSADKDSKTAVVAGGEFGSPDSDADTGTRVLVKPRFTDWQILRALNADLADLSSPNNGLYRVKQTTLTPTARQATFSVPADVQTVLDVRYLSGSDWRPVTGWRLDRKASTITGLALVFPCPPATTSITVVYGAAFTTLPTEDIIGFGGNIYAADADVTVTGLPGTAWDLPPLGAAVNLMAGREIPRNFPDAQGDSRRSTEVPPGSIQASSRGLVALRERRIQDEVARIHAMFPRQAR